MASRHECESVRNVGVGVKDRPIVFVVDDGHCRFGILTDLGHVFEELQAVVDSLDAVLLESNYDSGLLEGGPYPEFLKARIRGRGAARQLYRGGGVGKSADDSQ